MAIDLDVQESYARALLGAAEKADAVEVVHREAREVADYLETHADRRLRTFFESPHVPEDEKDKLLRNMFGGRVHDLLVNFMRLMIRKRRAMGCVSTLRRFCELVDERWNVYSGVISTARPLTEEDRARLRESLERHTGSTLRLRYRVDPALIGGVRFTYRDALIDNTLRGALDEVRGRLTDLRLRLAPPEVSS